MWIKVFKKYAGTDIGTCRIMCAVKNDEWLVPYNFKTTWHKNAGQTFLHSFCIKRTSKKCFHCSNCNRSVIALMPPVKRYK